MMIFVDLALKTTLLIAVAALCSLALHRASAAARHLLWTMAMAGCLLLPVLTTVLPDWRVAALPDLRLVVPGEPVEEVVSGEGAESIVSPATGRAAETVEPSESRPGYRDGTDAVSVRAAPPWYVWAWGGGGLLVLLVFAASARQLHLAVRRYRELDDPGWREDAEKIAGRAGLSETSIRLLRSSNLIAPMTWGVWRPVIVLPRDCIDWSREQRHEVLLHEIAHVRRRDCLTQWLANLACVIYWCHPLMWWASRRMLTERERACDDQVIQGGAKPADYAKNLIEIARTLGGGRPMLPAGVAMARRSQVSGRLLAVLDPGCNRGRPRRTHVLMAAVAVLAVLVSAGRVDAGTRRPGCPGGHLRRGRGSRGR
ncbi:M56 family metallopeptidase [bacterium]|nr:M56 family metallopeptidase [bacterium]